MFVLMFVLMLMLVFMSMRMTMSMIVPPRTPDRMIVIMIQRASTGTSAHIVVVPMGMVRSALLVSVIMSVRISIFELQDFGFVVLDGGLQFGYIGLNSDLHSIFREIEFTREGSE